MVVLDTDGLAKQDKEALDLKTLAADTPEVISRQVRRSLIELIILYSPYFLAGYFLKFLL